MRNILLIGLLFIAPGVAADASDVPGGATWYLHVNLEKMKSAQAGKVIYDWMEGEVFADVREEAGIDIGEELDQLTAYSVAGYGPVIVVDGNISQTSKDRVMALIAAGGGDLIPKTSSRKSYYRLSGSGESSEAGPREANSNADIEADFESLQEEAWISTDVSNKIIVTADEQQMKDMLKNGGRISGSRAHKGALVVLTAEKALLQAGMDSRALIAADDGNGDWNSNILRNTEQVAILVAAVANKLAVEARLITSEAAMAESLASVARGLLSLVAFDDGMDAETLAVLQGTKVEAQGNALTVSVALDPGLVVSALED